MAEEYSAENWLRFPNGDPINFTDDWEYILCLPWQNQFIQSFNLDHCGCSECSFQSVKEEFIGHWQELGLVNATWLPFDFIDEQLEIPNQNKLRKFIEKIKENKYSELNISEDYLYNYYYIQQEVTRFTHKLEVLPFTFDVTDYKRFLSLKTALYLTFYRRRIEWIFKPRDQWPIFL